MTKIAKRTITIFIIPFHMFRAVIIQVLSNNGKVLLRIARDRGWVSAESSKGDPVFTEVKGTLTRDT